MNATTALNIKLFSYGTLLKEKVQLANFGRKLQGSEDSICGFKLSSLEIKDPNVLEISGEAIHRILTYSGNPNDKVSGMVFDITQDELLAADNYEVSDYKRIEIYLHSGTKAWVYVDKHFELLSEQI